MRYFAHGTDPNYIMERVPFVEKSNEYREDMEYLIPEEYIENRDLELTGTPIQNIIYLNNNIDIYDRRRIYYWSMYKLPGGIKYKKYAFGSKVGKEIVYYHVPGDASARIKKNLSFIVPDNSLHESLNSLVDNKEWKELIQFIGDTSARSVANRCIIMILEIMELNVVSDSLTPTDGKIGFLYNLYMLDKNYTVTYRFGGSATSGLTMNLLDWALYLTICPELYYAIYNLIGL